MLLAGNRNDEPAGPGSTAVPRGLVYSSDSEPGFTRLRKGKGFAYRTADGKPVKDAAEIARIRKLAIPPAYTRVWICPHPDGHIQATGRDARGRKQYRLPPIHHRRCRTNHACRTH